MTDNVQQEGGAEAPAEAVVEAAVSPAASLLASKTTTEAEPAVETQPNDGELPDDFEKMFAEKDAQYKEQQKLLRSKGLEAPESYELAEGVSFEEGDEMLASFDEIAKKHNLTNDAFNDIIAMKMAADEALAPNREAEMEKLGSKGAETLKAVGDFYSSKLSPEGFAAVESLATTAEGVMALDTLRRELAPTQPVTSRQNVTARSTVSEADAAAMLSKATGLRASGNYAEADEANAKATAMFEVLYPKK